MTASSEALVGRARGLLSRFDIRVVRDYGVVIAFAALFVTLSVSNPVFLTVDNMKNLAFQTAPVGIIAVGGTLVFIAGGFDLSVGAISAFTGIMAAKIFNSTGIGLWGSLILGPLVGLGFGLGNGLLRTRRSCSTADGANRVAFSAVAPNTWSWQQPGP